MRLVTANDGPRRFLGALCGEGVADLLSIHRDQHPGSNPQALTSMRALIDSGDQGLRLASEAAAEAERRGRLMDLAQVRLGPPLPDPAALRCCSVFPGHYRNCKRTISTWLNGAPAPDLEPPPAFYATPAYYKGNHLNLTGPNDAIPWPDYAEWLDFELELALIVGKGGIDVEPDRWREHVFGWTIYNDVSARHPLLEEVAQPTGPSKGKDFDGANILGPCIVTADELDAENATGRAMVNGEVWGSASSAEMAHGWGAILAHRSRAERLHPGEVIASGCFTGCSGLDHDRPPQPGDMIELEIDGIGVLRNRIARRS